jgi:hypothetical protein
MGYWQDAIHLVTLGRRALLRASVGIAAESQVAASPFPTHVLRIRTQLEQSQILTDMAVPDPKSLRVRDHLLRCRVQAIGSSFA